MGCSGEKSLEKMDISGNITFNGDPLESGEIMFRPEPGSNVPPSAANIINGEYRAAGQAGIAAGTYRVEIHGFEVDENASKDLPGGKLDRPPATQGMPVVRKQYLPPKYNSKSTLDKLTVTAGGEPVQQDYELEE